MHNLSPGNALLAAFLLAAALPSGTRAQAGLPSAHPVNPDASPEARILLDYIRSTFGKQMLTGQMEAPWGIEEIPYLQTHTGKLPAIRGQDLINESSNNREINEAINWWKAGGIPTIMWHWGAPTVGEGYDASKGTIDVNKCFVAGSNENKEMMLDLKRIADHLAKLRDAKVPVIWRPMHECSGGWFWWDKSGGPAFVQLWKLMFDYFTKERGLNNLIWFLGYDGSPSAAYNPGPGYYDIVGGDTYATNSPFAGIYNSAKTIHGTDIPIALHECGSLPDPAAAKAQDVLWSWFMVWHTGHLSALDKTALKAIYNHDLTLTRDELPSFADWTGVGLARHSDANRGSVLRGVRSGATLGFIREGDSGPRGFDAAGRALGARSGGWSLDLPSPGIAP
jgi:mannan endo-1,4-beta-mannosidase